jgi:hypothetical protein
MSLKKIIIPSVFMLLILALFLIFGNQRHKAAGSFEARQVLDLPQ